MTGDAMIEKMDRESFDKVYAIMDKSFPFDEIRPYDEQKKLLDNLAYSVYVTSKKDAFIATWEFCDFVFIEHFAVAEDSRNAGLGSKILREFLLKQDKMVCLEVELPDTKMGKRRIGFYERNGFFLNEYEYFQPPIAEGKSIVPLMIMTSKQEITKEVFEEIRNTLYREVYKYKGID